MSNKNDNLSPFLTNNPDRNKIIKLFYNAIYQTIPEPENNLCAKIASEIENYIFTKKIKNEIVRSKYLNLKIRENNLCKKIYKNEISIEYFMNLTSEEMKSQKMKLNDKICVEEGISESQIAETAEETDLFLCFKCKKRTCTYRQLQTRSADEPMTTYVFCKCGNTWKC